MNFTASVNDTRTITFMWKAPEVEHRNGHILSYNITCVAEMQMTHPIRSLVSDDQEQAVITGFFPSTLYNCSIAALTEEGEGPIDYLTIETPEDCEFITL